MELKLQIISLIFSTFYGIVFSICTNLNYRFLFSKNKVFKIVFTIIYMWLEKYMEVRVGLKPEEYSEEETKYDEMKEILNKGK